ncbi:hypothetical protein H310_01208 [Aphanomyces invadans]|uniref:K-box domain-containing protein n=1 Tax=Aphanomyces invadans TaxID=157072 RepID=A0A024UR67_9STRA|nr:hypothetical protein H310_01208 [Aphanomyces invadans]ETW08680.1 hypothetical protein H310_01208 [Aphanomyces invadans]|eukprot:XP_008862485.1 hypothetical protein H310_01208 [Aphanomyces invadans]
MAASRTSTCCLGVVICGIVSAIGLLGLGLVYWSIPAGKPSFHTFTKLAAERFTSEAELHAANPLVHHDVSDSHSHVLFSWQSPLCAKHLDEHDRDTMQSRFHVQHWSDVTWKDMFHTLSSLNSGATDDPVVTALPRNIYTNDCFASLENVRTSQQISFRVRSRADPGAIFQLFQSPWSAWSNTVVLPPFRTSPGDHGDDRAFYDQLWWGLTVVSLVTALYSRWNVAPDTMHGAAKRKIAALQEEVTNLKQELLDAENENKLLMRLKGYGLEVLSWKELHELEHELHVGLETIELHKEVLHPSLLDSGSHCSSSASSRSHTPPPSPRPLQHN